VSLDANVALSLGDLDLDARIREAGVLLDQRRLPHSCLERDTGLLHLPAEGTRQPAEVVLHEAVHDSATHRACRLLKAQRTGDDHAGYLRSELPADRHGLFAGEPGQPVIGEDRVPVTEEQRRPQVLGAVDARAVDLEVGAFELGLQKLGVGGRVFDKEQAELRGWDFGTGLWSS